MTDYLTLEGLKKIKKELEHLKTVRRPEVIERIYRAKDLGDLSENAEYADAKDEQGFIEGRIIELKNLINKAKIISKNKKEGVVALGSTVVIECDGVKRAYTIIGSKEANPAEGIISNESPFGKAFLGKKIGEIIKVQVPKGIMTCKIIEIN